jgi:Rrf2 family protein
MLDLAVNHNGEYISIKCIAERQGISEKYLEQIIAQISRGGFLKSARGAHGGYQLAWDPKEYTVGMILRLMEGELSPVGCLDDHELCDRMDTCVTVEVWQELKEAIEGVVDHITLADLVKRYYEKGSCEYVI